MIFDKGTSEEQKNKALNEEKRRQQELDNLLFDIKTEEKEIKTLTKKELDMFVEMIYKLYSLGFENNDSLEYIVKTLFPTKELKV